jgi:hypothetical protein
VTLDSDAFMEVYDVDLVTEVIRPAAIIPEEAARAIVVELTLDSVLAAGHWLATPSTWTRYDRPWTHADDQGEARVIGRIQVAYGTPSRYEITIYRVTITEHGHSGGWSIPRLCNEVLAAGGLTLDSCPRADLKSPPRPFRFR